MPAPATSLEHWLTVDTVVRFLADFGVQLDVSAASARELPGRNLCFKVGDAHRTYFVKQYDEPEPLEWAVRAERQLAMERPPTHGVLVEPSRLIVVSPWQAGFAFDQAMNDRWRLTRETAIGATVDAVRRSWELLQPLRESGMRGDPHWAVTLRHPHVDALRYLSRAQLDLLQTIQRSEPLSAALLAVEASWLPQVVLHGDLRSENVLVDNGRISIVDWEAVQLGPRAWDLACVIAMVLLHWLLLHDAGEALGYRERTSSGVSAGDIACVVGRAEMMCSEEELSVMLSGALLRLAFEGAANASQQTIAVQLLAQMAVNVARQGIGHFVD